MILILSFYAYEQYPISENGFEFQESLVEALYGMNVWDRLRALMDVLKTLSEPSPSKSKKRKDWRIWKVCSKSLTVDTQFWWVLRFSMCIFWHWWKLLGKISWPIFASSNILSCWLLGFSFSFSFFPSFHFSSCFSFTSYNFLSEIHYPPFTGCFLWWYI